MVKKFTDFISEELKPSTYYKAASMLRQLGGKHISRAKDLEDWIIKKRAKEYGEYKININVVETISRDKTNQDKKTIDYWPLSKPVIDNNYGNNRIIKKGPLSSAYTGFDIFDPLDEYTREDMHNLTDIWINFSFKPLEDDTDVFVNPYTISCFTIKVSVSWKKENESHFMVVDGIELVSAPNDFESKILFSERKDALKFKRTVLNNLNKEKNYDYIRQFFLEFSDSEQLEKITSLIKEIPINKLYQ